jgi:hypothetical protein
MTKVNRDKESQLTAERLREVLSYSPDSGVWRWKVSMNGRVRAGSVAGCVKPPGTSESTGTFISPTVLPFYIRQVRGQR